MKRLGIGLVFAAMAMATPAAAQQDLSIAAGQPWTHRHSKIVVPSTLGGAPLAVAKSYADDELDVGLSFNAANSGDILTFYIFRDTNGGVPVWMSQARWAIEHSDSLGKVELIGGERSFTPPGQTSASGLKAVYRPHSESGFASTGVALLPIDGWYVKLRATSRTRSPEELAASMEQTLREIRWPAKIGAQAAARPVSDCSAPLEFAKTAKDAPKDLGSDLMASLVSGIVANKQATPDADQPKAMVQWCRDSIIGKNQTVYRANSDADAYLLAFGDNGNGIWVGPDNGAALMKQIDSKAKTTNRYAITLHMAGEDVHFVAQDRLPSPLRVVEIVNANRRVTSVPTWGDKKKVRVNSDAM